MTNDPGSTANFIDAAVVQEQLASEDVTCGTAASWRRLKGARRACYYLHTQTPALGVIFSVMIVFHQYDTVIYQSLKLILDIHISVEG